ncbi:T6SS phospholipase effector Tle1-like catalytic domain-containing protein [Olleya sp. HaHaR_3_96]|uniref:T6SS phospholipase effector Tle1-like catalytic domain-containing protein n=1 Tax=Olleya sp. HaHaR_3_96 TaxID=2745560 RepID=UPI001C4F1D8D|nr:DUF2235 domain-containing protein [Olleya sp. HaHaR_3_96]QXP58607.1 DUF2235 domain-containing protein [Olleya sp. HaHaR_3_96]
MPIGLTAAPVGASASRSLFSGLNVNTAKVNVGNADYEEHIPEDHVNVTVGIFFDGTLNNRKNTEARLEHEKKVKGESYNKKLADSYNKDKWYSSKQSGSYNNDFSNVSRMEPAYEKIKEEKLIQLSLYIEGIGTEDLEDDGTWGKSMGKGATGVKGKVKKGCEMIAAFLEEAGIKKINRLQIDSYGFSRGAAAARHFIFEINQKKGENKEVDNGLGLFEYLGDKYAEDGGVLGEELANKKLTPKLKTTVRFVGLYDTVASFGMKHTNDTAQLHLDAISKASFTFQLAAADEHRDNFRLTNIKKARQGVQKFLPGVHSDIGGGYTDKADEEVTLDYATINYIEKMEVERQNLIDLGWYLPGQIKINNNWGSLRAERKGISNKYSHIPLHVMVEYSLKKVVKYDFSLINEDFPIKNEDGKKVKLTDVKKRIDAYVKGEKEAITFNTPTDKVMLKNLRNEYFHFSAHYNDRVLGLIAPMSPNRENGVRTRVIQDG